MQPDRAKRLECGGFSTALGPRFKKFWRIHNLKFSSVEPRGPRESKESTVDHSPAHHEFSGPHPCPRSPCRMRRNPGRPDYVCRQSPVRAGRRRRSRSCFARCPARLAPCSNCRPDDAGSCRAYVRAESGETNLSPALGSASAWMTSIFTWLFGWFDGVTVRKNEPPS